MTLDKSKNVVLQLVQKSLNPIHDINTVEFKALNWNDVMHEANTQGVLGVAFGAFEHLPKEYRPERKTILQWYGQCTYIEHVYDKYVKTIRHLAEYFSNNQIPSVLMKGYGLSLNYPVPNRRPTGDIDFFHCGTGAKADEIVKGLGVKVKQNEEKHSTYDFEGVHVENHATIICELEHKSLGNVERFLEDELTNNSVLDSNTGCLLPSDMFNAVYLPLHLGAHFVYNEASLRQVVDWILFLRKHHSIDWDKVRDLAEDGGYFQFLCCLNGIVIDYFGVEKVCIPKWPRDMQIEKQVLEGLFLRSETQSNGNVISKLKRYINGRWKYQLVFGKESHSKGFFRRVRSWLIWKWGIGGNNIWKRVD